MLDNSFSLMVGSFINLLKSLFSKSNFKMADISYSMISNELSSLDSSYKAWE